MHALRYLRCLRGFERREKRQNGMDSIKRLAATVIEFTAKTADRLTSKGTEIKLIDVAWQEYE